MKCRTKKLGGEKRQLVFQKNGMRCNVLPKEYEGLYSIEVDLIGI